MSEAQAQKAEEEFPIKKYLQSIKQLFSQMKDFDFRKFFQGIFTFVSIVAAYFIIQIVHHKVAAIEQITKLNLRKADTLPLLFLGLSLYFIFWNMVARFLKNRALHPPPKSDEYEQITENEEFVPPTLAVLPAGEHYTHEIIQQALNKTIYLLLLLGAVTSYAYFNQHKRPKMPWLIDIERINLLAAWFMLAVFLDLIGRLLQQWTKIPEFRVLGISMGCIIGVIVLGLANGLNTFIFI